MLPKPTTLNLNEIIVEDRIREDYGDVQTLADSIRTNGLLVPLLIRSPDNRLIDGGRRFAALNLLGVKEVAVYYREEITDSQLRLLELECNLRRKEMTWQESCRAIGEVHKLQAREAALQSNNWTTTQTGDLLGVSRGNVDYAIKIASLIESGDESIIKAVTLRDALRILISRKEEEAIQQLRLKSLSKAVITEHPNLQVKDEDDTFIYEPDQQYIDTEEITVGATTLVQAQLERNTTNPNDLRLDLSTATTDLSVRRPFRIRLDRILHNTCALEYMRNNRAFCSHIITDPPYAIDMSMFEQTNQGQNVDSVRQTHDVEQNKELLIQFAELAYTSIFEHGGYACVWCDIMQWELLYKAFTNAGFKVQRWPVIWQKEHTCINQAANFNFTKDTELCMIARKGNATLMEPQTTSVISANGLAYKNLFGNHPFVKPPEVWEFLMNAISYEGQIIFDPFAGVGSSLNTFVRGGRKVIACEIDKTHYDTLVESVKLWLSGSLRNVEFV